MIILGIDPGTTAIGFAVLDCGAKKIALLDAGLLDTALLPPERFLRIHDSIRTLISRWTPAAVAVEKLFFAKNKKTAMAVAEARGIILLTAALQKITLFEYTPLEVKRAVTGYGAADKMHVEKIVRLSVSGAETLKARDDVFDAIAIAFTAHLLERFRPGPERTIRQSL